MSARVTAAQAITSVAFFHPDLKVLTVDQIRQWVRRGHVHRLGTDEFGYALYNLDDIVRHATRTSRLEHGPQTCHSGGGESCPA